MLRCFHDFELDERLYQLRRGGKPISLEPKVFDVLAYLLDNRDRIVSKDELLEKLWPEQVVSETALTRCIVAARKAVGDDGTKQEVIETQHGRGYRFVARVSERTVERKLAAVLSADVKGYSRLMGEDEVGTVHTLTAYRQLMTALIQQHHGRVVDSPGDNLLAEFASVVDAVQAAVAIQQELKGKNADLPASRRMEFRIGINLGDVIVEGERIYGDGVNIAARVESLAEASGICISGPVYDQVKSKLALQYESLGEQTVKNIAEPVRVYRIRLEPEAAHSTVEATQSTLPVEAQPPEISLPLPQPPMWPRRTLILSGLILLVGIIVAVQYLSLRPPAPSANIPPEAPQSLPLPDKPSIVVLPFVNMSEDPKQEYFSDGITEDLTSDLSQLSGLFVIARNSAFTYKGKAVKVQDVSKELGVRYVLEGSVRWADDQVRVTAQLIDGTTSGHLWSERYDRPVKDIFAVQDEIAQKIVTTLQLQLSLQEQGRIAHKTTNILEAYDSYLRGLEYYYRMTKEDNLRARQLYEKAIALDPQYAEAYARLGFTYFIEWIWRWSQDPHTLEQALAMGQRAIALNDSLPMAHALLGMLYAQKKQYEQALAASERAIAFDPNNAESYARQAMVLNFMGRSEEALPAAENAMRLNPHGNATQLIALGAAYSLTGRSPEAISTLKSLLARNPNHLEAYMFLSASYLRQWAFQQEEDEQTLTQAMAAAQRVLALSDGHPVGHRLVGGVYLCQKRHEQALAEMERALTLDPEDAWNYTSLAEVLGLMGRMEEAVQMVEEALRREPPIVDDHLADVGAV